PPAHPYPLSLHDALPISVRTQGHVGESAERTLPEGGDLSFERRTDRRTVEQPPALGARVRPGHATQAPERGRVRRPEPREREIRSEEHTSELQSRGHLVC